ncbi:MAG: hypothetical protein ACRDAW_02105 [Metamycoplasmataceae bacterium]
MKEKKNKVKRKKNMAYLFNRTEMCEKCNQETGAAFSSFIKALIYLGFVTFLIPGILMYIFLKPNICKCCGAKYGKSNFIKN